MSLRGRARPDLPFLGPTVAGVLLSLSLAAFLRLGIESAPAYLVGSKAQIFAITLIYTGVLYAWRPRLTIGYRRDYATWAIVHAYANAAAAAASLVFVYLQGLDRIGRGVFVLFGILHLFVSAAWHLVADRLVRGTRPPKRVLVVGSGPVAQLVSVLLREEAGAGLYPVGLLQVGDAKTEIPLDDFPIYSGPSSLREIARTTKVDSLILTLPDRRDDDLTVQLMYCRLDGLDVLNASDLYESLTGRVPLNGSDDHSALFFSLDRIRPVNTALKRRIDVTVATAMLLVLAPVMALVALLIRATMPGPVLYRQERLGRHGRPFQLLKFRTMAPDAEGTTGPVWAEEDDPRVTPLGRLLRRWRLDELPQLFNVLRDDMSLVGPRPEREIFVGDFRRRVPVVRPGRRRDDPPDLVLFDGQQEAISLYSCRLLVNPGITGWAQVRYPYAASFEETREKFEYDLYYIKYQSTLFDMAILLRTVMAAFRPSGR